MTVEVVLLQALSEQRRAEVRAAVCAVETARLLPVPAVRFRALAEVPPGGGLWRLGRRRR
ncbi:hypothetical protein [Streptomyces sp. NBC_00658]|uniref:hypothetical protein n=1 Tax=Streptomyces sp. NBC_00658 TaxID=2975800 RepID=UPI00324DD152